MTQAAATKDTDLLEIRELRQKIDTQRRKGTNGSLYLRLAYNSPYHPARLGGYVFRLLAILMAVFVVVCLAAPMFLEGEALRFLQNVDQQIPFGLPLSGLGVFIICLVAWFASRHAAKIIGRDCPLLPEEAARKADWNFQIAQLEKRIRAREKDAEENVEYSPATDPQISEEVSFPAARSRGGLPVLYETPYGPPSGPNFQTMAHQTPGESSESHEFHKNRQVEPPNLQKSHISLMGQSGRAGTTLHDLTRIQADAQNTPEYLIDHTESRNDDGQRYTIGADGQLRDPEGAAVEQQHQSRKSTAHLIDEEWLQTTLQHAQELATRYPVQASLVYSAAKDTPFGLTIERATPGVVNQSILDFIVFLSKIPPPQKAIISLQNMAHIDRQLYLTVATAMNAHCSSSADVNQDGSEIHISFLEPDACWKRYPFLPEHVL